MSTNKVTHQRCLSIETVNPFTRAMEHELRGPLVIRANLIEKELEAGVQKPFKEVKKAFIGDSQAMGTSCVTFVRQVISLCTYPKLLEDPHFPDDCKKRAKEVLNSCPGGAIGSYSHQAGLEVIRKKCAEFIAKRDGISSDWENIILTAGATSSVKILLSLLNCSIDGKKPPGIMIPIPQYPLYSDTLQDFNMGAIHYYLDELNGWGLNIKELKATISEARKNCSPRALVVINPGNPTSQVLSKENIREIIEFAYEENLFIFADEVYQDNVYDDDRKFYSFRKVLAEMGEPYCSGIEMASFMSCSKGYLGECGIRGAFTEIINMTEDVKYVLMKSLSAQFLCPTTLGQVCVYCLVNPPEKHEPSYDLFIKEKSSIIDSFKVRANMVEKAFNSIEGYSCNPVQGAMYAFPQFKLPPKAIKAAEALGHTPDMFYAINLLERTGVCVIAGSSFGQKPGTYHFRTTILPQKEKLMEMLELIEVFHKEFLEEYQ